MTTMTDPNQQTEWRSWKGYAGKRTRKRRITLLAGLLLLALLLLLLFLLRGYTARREALEEERDLLLPLTADQIIAIGYIDPAGEILSFVRAEGLWRNAKQGEASAEATVESGDAASTEVAETSGAAIAAGEVSAESEAPGLDQTAVGTLAASVTGVRLEQTMTGVTDPGQYGLTTPRTVISLTDVTGSVTTITIGDDNEATNQVYCALNEDFTTVYAVSPSIEACLSQTGEDYLTEGEASS